MNRPHFDRGNVLLERDRFAEAEEEFRKALAMDPQDPGAHAGLASCLCELERYDEAIASAEDAIGLAPDWDFPHRVKGVVLLRMDKPKLAEPVAGEAVELDPEEAANFALLAATLIEQKRWRETVAAAESGLELDPESAECANLRAFALVQLGQADQAELGLGAALQHDPENAATHMNLGWSALNRGDGEAAVRHYREALRLEPDSDGARAGLVESLRSRNVVYRAFLKWFLFLTRVPRRTALMVMIGTIFARRGLVGLAEAYPSLSFVFYSIFVALVAFILMSWIAAPLFNLVLRLSRDGRYALNERELRTSNWLGSMLLGSAIAGASALAGVPNALGVAIVVLVLVIPVVRTIGEDSRVKQRWLSAYTIGMTLVGSAGLYYDAKVEGTRAEIEERWGEFTSTAGGDLRVSIPPRSLEEPEAAEVTSRFGELEHDIARRNTLVGVFVWGFVLFTWVP